MPSGKARYHPSVGKQPYVSGLSPFKQLQRRREQIQRDRKKQLKTQGIIGNRIPFIWEWRCGDEFGTVNGFTRGDARGEIKKILGIPRKKSLPEGTQIRKVEFNEPST
jgi:hypothetical protein